MKRALLLIVFCLLFSLAKITNAQVIKDLVADAYQNTYVTARLGMPTVMEFEGTVSEVVISGVGDWREKFEIEKFGNRVLVKPYKGDDITLIVITESASYSVIVSVTKGAAADKNYQSIVRIKRPQIDNTAAIAASMAVEQAKRETEQRALDAAIKQKKINDFLVSARPKNRSYTVEVMTVNPSIVPEDVFDDGVFTYIKFRKNQKVPAIYEYDFLTQQETMVNFHINSEDYYVVQGILKTLVLRRGKEELALHNESFNINGTKTGNRTSQATVNLEKINVR
jgi:type IV secretion system protein VirB9